MRPTMTILAVCVAAFATACTARPLQREDLVGTWVYDSRGDGPVEPAEARQGRVTLRADGRLEVRNVSGIVVRVDQRGTFAATGRWALSEQRPGFLERRQIEIVYDDRPTPIIVHYDEYRGDGYLTFARDEEAGRWVKYRKRLK